jgi:[FeFe] hydrogenase H-cluster maturation GTPase HydF
MEIHNLGPVKIIDTAGINEKGDLGEKKRKKSMIALEESDLCLLTIDFIDAINGDGLSYEKSLFDYAMDLNKQVLIIYNLIENKNHTQINEIEFWKNKLDNNFDVPSIVIDIQDISQQQRLIDFILKNFKYVPFNFEMLPKLDDYGCVILNIPMDEETPEMRLLRPQEMVIERLMRKFITPVLFRMDLKKARSNILLEAESESKRYLELVNSLQNSPIGLQMVITDSQAFDIISKWTPQGIPYTSFSIIMTNFMTYGNMEYLVESTASIDNLKENDTVLIAESCNHNRKCDDIGTAQLPRLLQKRLNKKLNFEFSFGRVFPDDLSKYAVIIHCGSCMTDRQKYARRLSNAQNSNIPFTNYGMVLSYCQNRDVFANAVAPFGVDLK